MFRTLPTISLLFVASLLYAQINYTARDINNPYPGPFRPGTNLGYFPNWNTFQLGDLAAGNPAEGVMGVGAKVVRPVLSEEVLEIFGYDIVVPVFEHFKALGMDEHTATLAFPADWHRDQTQYCPGVSSELFANLYEPIWDGGANGTPYNENNYFAAYVYKTVSIYNEYVRFWEIWNEPGFDETGNTGWREPGDPQGNWWDQDPAPCEYKLKAPIEHYVRTIRIAYEVIKTIAPDDYVIVAGFGYQSFLDAVCRNTDNPNGGTPTADYPLGGAAYFDVMGLHAYPHFDGSTTNFDANFFERHSDQAALGLLYRRDFYQEVFDNYGYDGNTYPRKQTIVTEMNAPREFAGGGAYFASTIGQRNYIIKAYIVAMLNNIHQWHVFGMSDNPGQPFGFDKMGLYQNLRNTPPYQQVMNEEGIAMKTTSDFLWGTTYDATQSAAMNMPNGAKGHAFRKPDGSYVYVLWAETQIDLTEQAAATYSFPPSLVSGLETRLHRWDYSVSNISALTSPNNISLDATPIFFTVGTADNNEPPRPFLSTATSQVTGPFTVNIGFTEAVVGLELADFQVTNGLTSDFTGTGDSYTLKITPINNGLVTIQLPFGVCEDLQGKDNVTSNLLSVNYDSGGGGGGDKPDLELSLSVDQNQFTIYSNVTYTLTLSNRGGADANNISVDFKKPDQMAFVSQNVNAGIYSEWLGVWNIPNLAAGASAQVELTLFTLQDVNDVIAYAQVATASPDDEDSRPGNNPGPIPNEDDEAVVTISPGNGGGSGGTDKADLSLSNLSAPGTAQIGDLVNFSFTLNNNGTAAANGDYTIGVFLSTDNNLSTDDLDLGFINTGNTPIGSIPSINSSFTVPTLSGGNYYIILQADRDGQIDETNEGNNTTSKLITITTGGGNNGVDLALSLDVNTSIYNIYQEVTYTLRVENNGNQIATGVNIEFPLPNGLVYTSDNPSSGDYDNWLGNWNAGSVPAGSSEVLELTLFTLVSDQVITNYAQVSSLDQSDIDSSPGNGTCCIPNEDDEAVITIQPGTSNIRNSNSSQKIVKLGQHRSLVFNNVYPNPVDDQLMIEMGAADDYADIRLQLFDIMGRSVKVKAVDLKQGKNVLSLDVQNLTAGMYYILLEGAQRHVPIYFVKTRL